MTELDTKTYDIFNAEDQGFDGVAIFVMSGLTAFRPQSYDYIRKFGPMSFSTDNFEVCDLIGHKGEFSHIERLP